MPRPWISTADWALRPAAALTRSSGKASFYFVAALQTARRHEGFASNSTTLLPGDRHCGFERCAGSVPTLNYDLVCANRNWQSCVCCPGRRLELERAIQINLRGHNRVAGESTSRSANRRSSCGSSCWAADSDELRLHHNCRAGAGRSTQIIGDRRFNSVCSGKLVLVRRTDRRG